jgi:hypothetical protein
MFWYCHYTIYCMYIPPFHNNIYNRLKPNIKVLNCATRSQGNSVAIATDYGLYGRSLIPGKNKFFSSLQRPDQIWAQHSLLSNGYLGLFPRE